MEDGWVWPVGWRRGVYAQFSGILESHWNVWLSRRMSHPPVFRIMVQSSGVACTHMYRRNPFFMQVELHKFIHIPHHNHIGIQHHEALR